MITLTSPKEHAFRLRINKEGLLLYAILFAIGFGAYSSGNNLLFLVVSVIATFFAAHSMLNLISRHNNEIRRRLPRTVFAGEPFSVAVAVTNRKRFFSTFSVIAHEDHKLLRQSGRTHFIRVKAGATEERRYEAVVNRRGVFRLDRLWLECRFPFGLTQHSISYSLPDEVVVYPRLIPVPPPREIRKGRYGDLERQEKGFGFNLYNLRPYQEGESCRLIHWRTSARQDQLMVKEFEDEQQRHVTLVFENTGDPGLLMDELFEQGVSQAASLAARFIREGWQVELVTLTGAIPHGSGGAHLKRILHHLALIGPVPIDGAEAERRLSRRLHPDAGRVVWVNRLELVRTDDADGFRAPLASAIPGEDR